MAKKIQEEIDNVIGRDRLSSLKDRANMPYTMAAIFELLRYISHVPLGLPHLTTEDVMFRGYLIPANTTVGSPNRTLALKIIMLIFQLSN